MGLQSVQATKEKTVAKILENETYMPESGVIRQLTEALLRLSKNDLELLDMIISLKIDTAASYGSELVAEILDKLEHD